MLRPGGPQANSEFGIRSSEFIEKRTVQTVGATLAVARAVWFRFRGSLRQLRGETDILSLCLSKEKEPKRNDPREGKIAISSPPETHPNSNAQEGRSPLGTPPGRTHSPGGSVSFRPSCRAGTSPAPTWGRKISGCAVGARPRAPRRPDSRRGRRPGGPGTNSAFGI